MMSIVVAGFIGLVAIAMVNMAPFFFDALAPLWQSQVAPIANAVVVVGVVAVLAIVTFNVVKPIQTDRARLRVSRFAAANGMTYLDRVDQPPMPGTLFTLGHSRVARMVVRRRQPRFVEFGNHSYTTGKAGELHEHRSGYVAIRLDSRLPHMVLDAVANDTFGSSLSQSFAKDQRLSLEGDFDRHFRLYCLAGYEADALYLFTPDIMARFIDHAAHFDVEIVGEWMFLYSRDDLATTDPATWARLFDTVEAVTARLDQWTRWSDDRRPRRLS